MSSDLWYSAFEFFWRLLVFFKNDSLKSANPLQFLLVSTIRSNAFLCNIRLPSLPPWDLYLWYVFLLFCFPRFSQITSINSLSVYVRINHPDPGPLLIMVSITPSAATHNTLQLIHQFTILTPSVAIISCVQILIGWHWWKISKQNKALMMLCVD